MKGLNLACLVLASTEGCLRLGIESHSMMERRMESTGSCMKKRHGSERPHENVKWFWITGII
jgi:hypothetical protein